MMNSEYRISKTMTKKKKQLGNSFLLLILVISLVLSTVTPGALRGETEKEKKKQTQSSKSAESKSGGELKDKSGSKPKTEPFARSEPGTKSRHKRIIIAGEPKKYTGEPGTFIFHEADIRNVLLFFGKTYKLNIVIDPGVSGKVTIRLINVPWDQALDLILKQHGLAMSRNGNLITAKKLKK